VILDDIPLHEVESVTLLQSSIQHCAEKTSSGVQKNATSAAGMQPGGPGQGPLADEVRSSPPDDSRYGLVPRLVLRARLGLSADEFLFHFKFAP